MPSFMLHCLGAFAVTLHDVPITGFATDKMRAFLSYLALEQAQPQRREILCGLFWPEIPQSAAQNNLRVTLHRVRATLQRVQPGLAESLLISTRQTIQLAPALVAVDALVFQTLLASCASHNHADLASCDVCLTELSQAVELYRGELLAGLGLADAPAFEEWLLLRRETLHQQALAALAALAQAYEKLGNDAEAQRYASRQLALDPYQEEAHRQLMRLLVRRGLRTAALIQYETCCRLLREQLNVAPALETVALYEQIQGGQLDQVIRRTEKQHASELLPQPQRRAAAEGTRWVRSDGMTSPQHDWSEAPEVSKLYGRVAELAQLERWLVQGAPQAETPLGVRLVALLGMGGVGKTTLAAAFTQTVAAHFDVVIWRSLLNAPPVDELLRGLLSRLSPRPLVEPPASLDAQLALLLDYVRQQRCLLVLDNVESLLQPDQPGQMRPGYSGYTQLIQMLAEHSHQSCLLLTSRERPQGLARWQEDTPLVRTLLLEGLDAVAGQAMLTARGLTGLAAEATSLVERYSGNPLALKLVAQTVQELFGGDMGAFLAVESPIFDDIRLVLDQQFARLSPLEQEILIWLAIEREPILLPALRDNLVIPPAQRALIEALRALQRRSLVGQSPQGFLLPNVIMEYITDYLVEQVSQEIERDRGIEAWGNRNEVNSLSYSPTPRLLNRYALLKATAKEYVRASQIRLIMQPLVTRLQAQLGKSGLVERLNALLAALRTRSVDRLPEEGYAAGNLLNLLLHLEIDLRGYDFSHLTVWQAYLQGRLLPQVNFREANLAHSVFTYVFGDIRAIQFDASGQLLVAALTEGKLCLWRALDGQLLHKHQIFGAGASMTNFNPDGRLLATGDTDHQVRLWDIERGRLLHTLTGHTETPWAVIFSQDGRMVATSGSDGVVRLWDVQNPEPGCHQRTFQGHATAVPALAFTRDGQLLASGDIEGKVCVWRVRELALTAGDQPAPLQTYQDHTEEVHALAFDATGTILASGSHDHTVRLWDVQRGQTIHILRAHTDKIRALAMSPDGYTLASGGQDTFVCLWDVRTGQPLHTLLGLTQRTAYLAFSADGRTLATAGADADQTICLWDVTTGRRLDTLQIHRNHLYGIDFSPDGHVLASGGKDGIVRLWAVEAANQVVRTLACFHWLYSVAFSPDGTLLATAGREPTIQLWEVPSGRLLCTLYGHTNDVEAIQFSRDGQRLVSASRDRTVRVWDLADVKTSTSGQTLHILAGHPDRVFSCAFSPDGQWVASGSYQTVYLWNLDTDGNEKACQILTGHTNAVKCVAFSSDGRLLISSGFDQTVRLWKVPEGQALGALPAQHTIVTSLAFHPQGALLAMGATDHTVHLWELPTKRLLTKLRGHTNNVECVRFSADGQWLASAGADETVKLWETAAIRAGRAACRQTLHAPGPYAGMDITGVTGISAAQKAALKTLGAVDKQSDQDAAKIASGSSITER